MSTLKLKDDFFFPESDAFEMRSLVGLGCKKVWRQFVPAPHALSYDSHLQEAKEPRKGTLAKKSPRRDDSQVITHYQTTTYCCARAWRSRIAALDNNSAASTSFAAAWARSTSSKPRR